MLVAETLEEKNYKLHQLFHFLSKYSSVLFGYVNNLEINKVMKEKERR
jgi:hypothetical protein